MNNVFEKIKKIEDANADKKAFCEKILKIYNEYSENKIGIDSQLKSTKISRKDENFIYVHYTFIHDFGSYDREDSNDYGNRIWNENLRMIEEKLCFPETVFYGLTEPDRYSMEYVEEEIKCFLENETLKLKNEEEREKLFSNFSAFMLNSNYGVTPEEQFHTMLMSFVLDLRNCFNSNQWFSNKYMETTKYSHQVESTVGTVLKNCYQNNEEFLFGEVIGNLRSQIPAILQLWENNGDNCYYELDKMAEDIYDFNYCPHMNSKKYRAEAKEKVDKLIEDLYQKGFIQSKTIPTDSKFKDYMIKYIAMYDTAYMIILRNGILKDFIVDFDSNNTLSNIYTICEKIYLLKLDVIQNKEIIKKEDIKMIDCFVSVARNLIEYACQMTFDMDTKQLEFYDIDNGFGVNLFKELKDKIKNC